MCVITFGMGACTENNVSIDLDEYLKGNEGFVTDKNDSVNRDTVNAAQKVDSIVSLALEVGFQGQKTFAMSDFTVSGEGITPYPKGCYLHIYIYKAGHYPGFGQPVGFGVYHAYADGYVSSVYTPPSITPGYYNLYAVGVRNFASDKTPSFSSLTGYAFDLYNNLDYVWWKMENVHITKKNNAIKIFFSHECVKIKLNFEVSSGHTLNALTHVDINMGNPNNCIFDLATGDIMAAYSNAYSQQMLTLDGTSAEGYMLPFTTFESRRCMVNATVDGINKWYSLSIEVPRNYKFQAGNFYIYKVILE